MSDNNHKSYVVYILRRKHEYLYYGITNDPERQEIEHIAEGKKFTGMRLVSGNMSYPEAEARKQKFLEIYKKEHGEFPRYNKA